MLKNKVWFVWGIVLYGSLECAMTPAGRTLIPQAQPVNQNSNMPLALREAYKINEKLKKEGKMHYVHDAQPVPPAVILDRQKFLDQEADKILALRKSRADILKERIKKYYVNDMSYIEQILDIVVDQSLIKSALYALCIDTVGCSADAAVRELGDMYTNIQGMSDWINGTDNESLSLMDDLRVNNCRFYKLISILHDNMGMLSLRNSITVTGETLDDMAYKTSLYPNLPEPFRFYLKWIDEQEAHEHWAIGAETSEKIIHSLVSNALYVSKGNLQDLKVIGGTRAFKEASSKDSTLIQRLKNCKIRTLYVEPDQQDLPAAQAHLNGMYMHIRGMNDYHSDEDKFAFIDKLRLTSPFLNQCLSSVENGMKGASFVDNHKNLMGSTVDEVMYKTNLHPTLKPFWRSYLIFKDQQKYRQQRPLWADFQFEYNILVSALLHSRGDKQELSEFENSSAWKNYCQKYGVTESLRQILQRYKKEVH